MDLTHITSQSLRRVLNLTERKDDLIKLVSEIETEIAKTLSGVTAPLAKTISKSVSKPAKVAKKSAKARKGKRGGKRGGLKDRILALLDAAGPKGLRVKDIARQLGSSPGNISVWFSTTGKKLTAKLAPGLYAVQGTKAAKPAKASQEPVKKTVKKPAKKSGLTAAGRARLSASMKARWEKHRAAKGSHPSPIARKRSKRSKA